MSFVDFFALTVALALPNKWFEWSLVIFDIPYQLVDAGLVGQRASGKLENGKNIVSDGFQGCDVKARPKSFEIIPIC